MPCASQAVYRDVSGDGLNASLTIQRLNGSAFSSSLAYTLAVQNSTGDMEWLIHVN